MGKINNPLYHLEGVYLFGKVHSSLPMGERALPATGQGLIVTLLSGRDVAVHQLPGRNEL